MDIIDVPDIAGPTAQLCWKQSRLMVRCDRRKDHEGVHSWEQDEEIDELRIRLGSLTPSDGVDGRPTVLNAYGRQCYNAGLRLRLTDQEWHLLIEACTLHRETFTNGYAMTLLLDKLAALRAVAPPATA